VFSAFQQVMPSESTRPPRILGDRSWRTPQCYACRGGRGSTTRIERPTLRGSHIEQLARALGARYQDPENLDPESLVYDRRTQRNDDRAACRCAHHGVRRGEYRRA